MELDFDRARWSSDEAGMWLSLRVTVPLLARRFVSEMKDRMYTAKLGEKRQKRSLDANAYAWVLMGKIAEKVGTCKDDVYLQMLERYGVYTHFIVKP